MHQAFAVFVSCSATIALKQKKNYTSIHTLFPIDIMLASFTFPSKTILESHQDCSLHENTNLNYYQLSCFSYDSSLESSTLGTIAGIESIFCDVLSPTEFDVQVAE